MSLRGLGAHEPRDPVHAAELVEHGAADARDAVGFELDAAAHVEGVDGVHEAEDAGGDEVVELDAVGQPRPDALAVVFHERQVVFDEPVAELAAGILFELLPDFGDIFRRRFPCDNRCHAILRDALAQVRSLKRTRRREFVLGENPFSV